MTRGLVLAVLLALLGCSKQKRAPEPVAPPAGDAAAPVAVVDAAPRPSGRTPASHRASAQPCGPGQEAPQPGAQGCKSDADCASVGKNGRCAFRAPGNSRGMNVCLSDMCSTDADCGPHAACVCRGGGERSHVVHVCLPGNCQVDGDCGAGGFCSPSAMGCFGERTQGFFCHTAADQCVDDADCKGGGRCDFATALGHWMCVPSASCPVG